MHKPQTRIVPLGRLVTNIAHDRGISTAIQEWRAAVDCCLAHCLCTAVGFGRKWTGTGSSKTQYRVIQVSMIRHAMNILRLLHTIWYMICTSTKYNIHVGGVDARERRRRKHREKTEYQNGEK